MTSENCQLQAAVVPFRRAGQEFEFCLITTSNGGWGIPKGFVESNETVQEAALKEAWEEAGLHGRLLGEPLGSYAYSKRGLNLDVTVYLMQVEQVDSNWLEADVRSRHWATADEAKQMLAWDDLRDMLRRALERLKGSQGNA